MSFATGYIALFVLLIAFHGGSGRAVYTPSNVKMVLFENTTASEIWEAPYDTLIRLRGWGGGGAGGQDYSSPGYGTCQGQSGQDGGFDFTVMEVYKGDLLNITVGAGGLSGGEASCTYPYWCSSGSDGYDTFVTWSHNKTVTTIISAASGSGGAGATGCDPNRVDMPPNDDDEWGPGCCNSASAAKPQTPSISYSGCINTFGLNQTIIIPGTGASSNDDPQNGENGLVVLEFTMQ